MGRLRIALVLALVLAGVWSVYAPSLDGDWLYDDLPLLHDPAFAEGALSPAALWEASGRVRRETDRRLTNATFILNFRLFGREPVSFHAVNVALHSAVVLALFAFARRALLLSGRPPDVAARVALWLAALFAWNPVQTQAVSYVWQRSTLLAALFSLLALWLLGRGLSRRGASRALHAAGAVALVPLAVLGKQSAIVLPGVMALTTWLFATRRSPASLALLLGAGVAAGSILVLGLVALWWETDEPLHLLRTYLLADSDYLGHLGTQARMVFFLLGLLLWPLPSRLSIDHAVSSSEGLLAPWTTAPAVLGVIAAVGLGLAATRRHPLVALCVLWWFAWLGVEVAVPFLQPVFEHRAYLPGAGPLWLLALGIERLGRDRRLRRRAVSAAGIALLLFWAGATWERNGAWTSQLALARDAAAKAPRHPRPHFNVGAAWEDVGLRYPGDSPEQRAAWDRAEAAYRRAVRLAPRSLVYRDGLARLLDRRGDGPRTVPTPPIAVWVETPYWEALPAPARHAAAYGALRRALFRAGFELTDPDALPGPEDLAARGVRGFRVRVGVRGLRFEPVGDAVQARCRIVLDLRLWPGGHRDASRALPLGGGATAPGVDTREGRETAARRCLAGAAERAARAELVPVLERLARFAAWREAGGTPAR